MSDIKLIPLICPSCGAKLDIPSDGNTAACLFCGIPLLVERDDASVMLKPLTDSLAQVRAELDKTSAALAVRRLQDEIDTLHKERMLTEVNAKALVSQRYAEIAQIQAKSSLGNVATIGAIVFFTVFVAVQALVDLLAQSSNYAWIGFIVAVLAAGGVGMYIYMRAERTRGNRIVHLRETLNTEWANAQHHIASAEKHLKELSAEMSRQQHIAAG